MKPGNIFVDQSAAEPRYVLGDFGIARGATDSPLTQVGSVVGTVDYCSPEQLAAEPVGPRSDQYALAATPLHLLTGRRPWPPRHGATSHPRWTRCSPEPWPRPPPAPAAPAAAPDPLRDCFAAASAAPGLTVEFVVYPADAETARAVEARSLYLTQGRELEDLPGWRSYLTAGSGGAAPRYCNVAYRGPGTSGLLEIYTLLTPADSAHDDAQRTLLCDRLPEVAAAIRHLVPTT